MPEVKIRKIVSCTEEIYHEGGPKADTPLRRAAVVAVIENPFAGTFAEDIQPFMEDLKPLGLEMATRLVGLLGGDPALVEGSEKAQLLALRANWNMARSGMRLAAMRCAMYWVGPKPSCPHQKRWEAWVRVLMCP